MKIVILFKDNPDADPNIRQTYMAEHLAFLETNSDVIEAAGPLINSDGNIESGIWFLNTNDFSLAQKLVKDDPFWPTGLRQSYTIVRWNQVFSRGTKQLNKA